MSALSEILSQLVESKYAQMTNHRHGESAIGYFSKKCAIDRSTLYQYLSGKRNLVNSKHFEPILSALQLTPQESQQVMEAYELTQTGSIIYNQRRAVKEILYTLSDVPAPHRITKTEHTQLHYSQPYEILNGELDIKNALFSLIQLAYEYDSNLQILLQPEHEILFPALLSANLSKGNLTVIHIICLEDNVIDGRVENLKRMKKILDFGTICPNYQPLYYYGTAAEHFHSINILPGLVVCGHAALQLSTDEKTAILFTDPKLISFFQTQFTQLTNQCKPLMTHNYNYLSDKEWQKHYESKESSPNFQTIYEICNGLCSIPFFTQELLSTYVNHKLPNYASLVDTYTQYSSLIHQLKRANHMVAFFNPSSVLKFIQDGVLLEYPELLLEKPLSIRDRKHIITSILQACQEGWYQIHFVDEKHFPIESYWGISVKQHFSVLMQYMLNDSLSIFYFDEPGIVEAFSDYFKALSESSFTKSFAESVELLQSWRDMYL